MRNGKAYNLNGFLKMTKFDKKMKEIFHGSIFAC